MIYREDYSSLVINKSAPGDWLGITETMLNTRYLFDSLTEESTETLCFSRNDFVNLLQNSRFSEMVIVQMSKMNHNLTQNLNVVSPLQKIVKFLLAKAELDNDKHETGGFQIATTRKISRKSSVIPGKPSTKVLQSKQLIIIKRNLIEVINLDGLRNIRE
jgi:CRP-like cAMP-binding protein